MLAKCQWIQKFYTYTITLKKENETAMRRKPVIDTIQYSIKLCTNSKCMLGLIVEAANKGHMARHD